MESREISDEEKEMLLRIYEDLRALADHPIPAVRGGARLALGEVAQIRNALGLHYELYSKDLSV